MIYIIMWADYLTRKDGIRAVLKGPKNFDIWKVWSEFEASYKAAVGLFPKIGSSHEEYDSYNRKMVAFRDELCQQYKIDSTNDFWLTDCFIESLNMTKIDYSEIYTELL